MSFPIVFAILALIVLLGWVYALVSFRLACDASAVSLFFHYFLVYAIPDGMKDERHQTISCVIGWLVSLLILAVAWVRIYY